MNSLKNLKSLRTLDVQLTGVTSAGLNELKELPESSKIQIGSRYVKNDDVEELERSMPACELVIRGEGK